MSENVQVGVKKCTGSEETPVQKMYRSRSHYAMLPADVMNRRDISFAAKVLLAAMNMRSFQSGHSNVSDGILADACGMSRGAVIQAKAQLTRVGLISPEGKPNQQIQAYKLLHPDMIADLPMPAPASLRGKKKKTVDLQPCGRCKTPCVRSKRTGWCKQCMIEVRQAKIVDGMVEEHVEKGFARRGL